MPIKIDPENDVPLYKQIADAIRKKILTGEFKPGSRLPSIRELASKINVSPLTVQQAIQELVHQNLVYRQHGRGNFVCEKPGRGNKKKLIGIVGSDISNPYIVSIVEDCREELAKYSYELLPALGQDSYESVQKSIQFLINQEVSGAFVLPIEEFWDEQLLWDFRRNRLPFIYLDSKIDLYYSDYVINDYLDGIKTALNFLASLGHKRIACVTAQPYTGAVKKKVKFFRKYLEEKGLPLPEHFVQVGDREHHEGGYDATMELLSHSDIPTAIMATNDLIAFGAYKAIEEKGLLIPQDISIIGSGDFNRSQYYTPSLTTLRIDVEKMCEIAVGIMMRRIATEKIEEYEQITIKPSLIIRASTREIAPDDSEGEKEKLAQEVKLFHTGEE